MRIAENQPVLHCIFCGMLFDRMRVTVRRNVPEPIITIGLRLSSGSLKPSLRSTTRVFVPSSSSRSARKPDAPSPWRAAGVRNAPRRRSVSLRPHFPPATKSNTGAAQAGAVGSASCSAVSFAGSGAASAIGVLCSKPCKTALSAAIRSSSSSSANRAQP